MLGNPLFTGSAWPRPNQVPNLAFWIDANDDAMFTTDAVTGAVAGLTSKDPNAIAFAPINPGPQYLNIRSRKPNWNGRTVLSAQAAGYTAYASSGPVDIATFFAATNKLDHTLFFVGRCDDTNGAVNGTVFYHYASGAVGHYLQGYSGGSLKHLCLSTLVATATAAQANGQEDIYCMRRTGNTLQLYINGVPIYNNAGNTGTPIVSTPATFYLLTATSFGGGYHGDFCELAMYARSLSDTERVALENHFARKWLGID